MGLCLTIAGAFGQYRPLPPFVLPDDIASRKVDIMSEGVRMSGEGNAALMIAQIFRGACRRAGLNLHPWPVTAAAFWRPTPRDGQLTLFE